MAKGWRSVLNIPQWVVIATLTYTPLSYADLKEDQVKAAYLYQISKFVFWPDNSSSQPQFNVCQLGPDQFSGNLEKMRGRQVSGKDVNIRQISTLADSANCHLLILSQPDEISPQALAKRLKQQPVLTVVNGENNASKGMVTFVIENQRVRLHINLALAQQAKLTFAANLLEVASHIYRGGEG